MQNDYQYSLMLYREGQTSLGQVSVFVDWEPARECTTFQALRQGLIPASETTPISSVQPLWHPTLGEPYVKGFRVHIETRDSTGASAEFSKSYFSDLAKQASSLLIKKGALRKAERFKYLVAAFPQKQNGQSGPRLKFTSTEVAPHLPIGNAVLANLIPEATLQGKHHEGDMPLLVPQRVLDEAKELSKRAGTKETGGILIGRLQRDVAVPEVFAEVTAQIPARHTEATLTSLTFTAKTWTDVRAALELRKQDEIMLGWWHSHPVREWCKDCSAESQRVCGMAENFFSAHDRALHRTIFPRAYSVALVVNDQAGDHATFSMFGWRQGLLESRGFYTVEAKG